MTFWTLENGVVILTLTSTQMDEHALGNVLLPCKSRQSKAFNPG